MERLLMFLQSKSADRKPAVRGVTRFAPSPPPPHDDPAGWGSVSGIINGDAEFQDGSYTIDSIILRRSDVPTSTLFLDFVAKNDAGSVADLVPEPSAFSLTAVGPIEFVRRRRT